ncbi:MAG: Mu transposase domain-containing protein [Steroidobacteraceae bacterium]
MVGYTKHHFFVRYHAFESFAHLNQLLERWLAEVADPRVHATLKEGVAERFARERPHLAPLPPLPFDTRYRESRHVALDALIEVAGNRYSVPAHLVGARVSVRIGLDGTLKVFDAEDCLVATHRLCAAAAGWQVIPEHHRRLWQAAYRVRPRDLAIYEEGAPCN